MRASAGGGSTDASVISPRARADLGGETEDARELDRAWYDDDEGGGGHGDAFQNLQFIGGSREDDEKFRRREASYQTRLTRRDGRPLTLAQSKKMQSIHADHNAWEENRMVQSGVVRVREVDLDFETEEEHKVMLLVHDTRPPFLESEHGLNVKKAETALPVKDPTSDLAMIARKGSTLLKEVRVKRDENKSRDRLDRKSTRLNSSHLC
jgi:pre-mRNA-splicing factor ATP-dependent RNA helicase DHX38/PRP16